MPASGWTPNAAIAVDGSCRRRAHGNPRTSRYVNATRCPPVPELRVDSRCGYGLCIARTSRQWPPAADKPGLVYAAYKLQLRFPADTGRSESPPAAATPTPEVEGSLSTVLWSGRAASTHHWQCLATRSTLSTAPGSSPRRGCRLGLSGPAGTPQVSELPGGEIPMTREVGPERRDGPSGMPKEIFIRKNQCPI
jgi:hypothetical protein